MSHKRRRSERDGHAVGIGTRHRLEVFALDGHPAALARDDEGRLFRVPNGVPGDVVQAEVVGRGRKDVWTRITSIERASKDRVDAPCPIVTRCGGCPWQSIQYRKQLQAKGRILRDAIQSKDILKHAVVHDPVGISPPLGYRTKIQMPFSGRSGDLKVGFYVPRSHELAEVDRCVVQHPLAEQIRPQVIDVLNRHPLTPYNEANATGELRTLLMRVAAGSGQVGVVLVVRSLDAYDWALMAAELTSIEGLTGVWLNENDTEGNSVLGARTVHLSGSRRLGDKIAGQLIERNPMTFFQTNHRATEKLVAAVGELLPAKMSDLFDVYAGGGMFSVAVGKRTERLHLVESHPDAVAAARATLQAANLPAEIHLGRAENILPSLVEDGAAADAMIIDPPRSGVAPEALAAIIKMAPSRIVYVSCQMRSLLRDLCALSEGGYSLEEVRAVDMFPHTPHIETVSLLTQ